MRRWSRELRERVVRVFAGLGLVLALAVMGAVLVSTAASGTEKGDSSVALSEGTGFGDGAGSRGAATEIELAQDSTDPSRGGVLLGAVLLGGGLAVLVFGARRPKAAPASVGVLQPVGD